MSKAEVGSGADYGWPLAGASEDFGSGFPDESKESKVSLRSLSFLEV